MDAFIIQTLEAATSLSVDEVKKAECQLKEWETNTGFYAKLLDVFLARDIDVKIRWIAVIHLKNGINKYWRRTGQYSISDEEKEYIRKAITVFDEEAPELALQLAVAIARILRSDVKIWPDGLQVTLQAIRSENDLHQHRGLLTLNQIAKELASKRLVSDRRVFHEISSNVFSFLQQLCYHYALKMAEFSSANNNGDLFLKTIQLRILITKILRRLLVFGAVSYVEDCDQMKYMNWCLEQIKPLFIQRKGFDEQYSPTSTKCCDKLEKLLILHMKILSEFEEHHASCFIPLITGVTQLCLQCIMSNQNPPQSPPMFVIYCGNLLRSVSRRYTKLEKLTECKDRQDICERTKSLILSIFTENIIKGLVQHLAMNYFPMTSEEVEDWSNDPEGFMLVEPGGDSHKYHLRPCMETLYVGLFYEFKTILIPFVVEFVKQVNSYDLGQGHQKSVNEQDMLKVCAIYKTIGLASYELFGEIDFDTWFIETLLPVFDRTGMVFELLKYHVMWMIGEWVNVKFSKANRIHLYRLMTKILMNRSNANDSKNNSDNTATEQPTNLALTLVSCKTLRTCLDDFDFVLEDFCPFLSNLFIALCQVLVTVVQSETKMVVLNVLSIVIERTGSKVQQNADFLIQYLPQLWEWSTGHNLLRGAVVNVLSHLVKGLGILSNKIYHITLPIIHHSTCIDQPEHVYLLEDGLELWHATIKDSVSMTSELCTLYRNIFPLFERASETLDLCLDITRSYLLLDASLFLQEHAEKFSHACAELLEMVKESVAIKLVQILTLSIRLQPALFLQLFQSNILAVFGRCLKDENYPPLMAECFSVLAYLVLHHSESLYKVAQVYCTQVNQVAYEDAMGRLLGVWLDKIDCMVIEKKKLAVIALVSLLPHKVRFVADRFALILDACVNVMYDMQKSPETDPDGQNYEDSLLVDFSEGSQDDGDEASTGEDVRERELLSQDPVHTINLLQFVRQKLNETKTAYGEQLFNEAMETMDPTVAKQLLSLVG